MPHRRNPTLLALRGLALLAAGAVLAALAGGAAGGGAATAALATKAASFAAPTAAIAQSAKAPVAFTAVKPGTTSKRVVVLPAGAPTKTGDAVVPLSGSLRVKRGRKTATFGALRLEFGLVSASITAKSGKGRLTLLTVKARKGSPLQVDARKGSVRISNATVTLASAGAKAIKKALGLKRTPSTKTAVGKLTLVRLSDAELAGPKPGTSPVPVPSLPVAPAPSVPAAPAPAPTLPQETTPTDTTPTDTTPTDTTPDAPPCWQPTPSGSTDWIVCDQPGGSDFGGGTLRSYINYILNPAWGGSPPGSITTTGGAERTAPGQNYDYRLPVATSVVNGDDTVTVTHTGRIRYALPIHGIDAYVENLVIEVNAARTAATVSLGARYADRDDPSTVIEGPVADAMTIDLTAAASTTSADGETTYEHAPAALTDAGRDIYGSGSYAIGAAWGAFTITVPDDAP